MPTFQFRELPHYFAVLRPTSGGGPSYQLCESLMDRSDEDNEFAIVKNWACEPARQNQCVRIDARPETSVFVTRVRNEEHTNEDIRQIRWWFLPHRIEFEEGPTTLWLNVIDSNKRFYLPRTFHRVIPVNLTSNELQETVTQYATQNQLVNAPPTRGLDFRNFFGGRLPQRTRSPLWSSPRRHSAPSIPSFVVELLVKDSVNTNKTCPITMLPFSELDSIGITSCFHLFDLQSLERWKEEHGTCPLCRSSISTFQVWKKPSSNT